MVDLKQSQDVDRLLSYLETHWLELPDVADHWETQMDSVDKEVVQLEWGIKEDNLDLLSKQVTNGNLSDEQHRRYEDLQRLIHKQRPLLERLFAGS